MNEHRPQTSEPIFTPDTEGVWLDLPADTYHAAPGVSQSRLKEFDAYPTPLHFKHRKPREATEAMQFGTLFHTAVLEPDRLATSYYVQPATYPAAKGEQRPWHGASAWCQAWLKEHADRIIIPQGVEGRIASMAERVRALPGIGDALKSGQREVSYFKRDPMTGLLLKCRCDIVATDKDGLTWIFDLKKVQSGAADAGEFQAEVLNRGYHIQAASYLWISGASRFVFVPTDDDEPFDAAQWELEPDLLQFGGMEYRRILDAFAHALANAFSEGYSQGIGTLKMPKWARLKMQRAQDEW